MANPEPSVSDRVFINRTVEAVIRIGVIAGLIGWCFMIARPFLVPIIWGAIIAVTVFHGYAMLEVALGGRRILAAVLVTLFMLVTLVVPSVLLGDSLVSGAYKLVESFQSGDLSIPPPPDSVARWPLIGEPIARAWTLASENMGAALHQASPPLKRFGTWLLSAAYSWGTSAREAIPKDGPLAFSPRRFYTILHNCHEAKLAVGLGSLT